jgi:hypothetical protein
MRKPEIESRHVKRIRKIVMTPLVRYIMVPWLFSSGLWMIVIASIARSFHPNIDVNSWHFFVRVFPIWAALLALTLYALSAIQVRILIHRKGSSRAIKYLFPEALTEKQSRISRFCYWALAIRHHIQEARQQGNYF